MTVLDPVSTSTASLNIISTNPAYTGTLITGVLSYAASRPTRARSNFMMLVLFAFRPPATSVRPASSAYDLLSLESVGTQLFKVRGRLLQWLTAQVLCPQPNWSLCARGQVLGNGETTITQNGLNIDAGGFTVQAGGLSVGSGGIGVTTAGVLIENGGFTVEVCGTSCARSSPLTALCMRCNSCRAVASSRHCLE
jgi:hypothetical protein